MIHAYDKCYLEPARVALGGMLDFAVYDLHFELAEFYQRFLSTSIAKRFGEGDFTLLVGKSGIELAYAVLEEAGISYERNTARPTANRSPEYWAGWALAYYQWETGLSFAEIENIFSIIEIVALYSPYHEMDIRHFCDKLNEAYRQKHPNTRLKDARLRAQLSQRQLADFSGVPLRTIQQYEQRQKDINKAQAETLILLARTLGCKPEALLNLF